MNTEPGKQTKAHPAAEVAGAIEESGNVDRIRNILFGSQMRDYEGRFQRLEERLAKDAAEQRADLQKRLAALETFMKGEVESMTARAKSETTERGRAMEKLGRDLAETAKALEHKIGGLDEQAAKGVRDLRQQLLDQSKALSDEMKQRHDETQAGLASEAQQIRNAMTGREALADMLTEVALRLKNEFRVPGAS